MLLDAAEGDRSRFERTFDACVIGTGPAGITLARRLAERGLDVALMEGGGLDFTGDSQDIYLGENVGIVYDPLDESRLRYFGGSSNHWAGRCRELDASDFERHAHLPLSGWPFGKSELDRYAGEADAILDLPPAADFPVRPVQQAHDRFVEFEFRRSEPVTQFGRKYHDELAASRRITVVLNANLVDLRLDETGRTVRAAVFRSFEPADPGFEISARSYALCAGGIENPRLLLNFTSQIPVGIGNENDLVGRFFCEHPHFRVGEFLYEQPIPAAEAASQYLAPTPAYLAEHGSVNFALLIRPQVEPPLAFGKELARSVPCAVPFAQRLAEQVLGRSLHCERRGLGAYFAQIRGDRVDGADLLVTAEQTLVRDSRVMLGEARDALGLRRTVLDWRLSEIDFASLRTAVLEFGAHCAEQGIGRARMHDWLMAEAPVVPDRAAGGHRVGGHHHMCSTRMSDDPREGVVDRNCRVHSVSNLYIGGSSAFATPGHANPTYTIVQLALRLGDHIANQQREGPSREELEDSRILPTLRRLR